jgi:hypothetical protein
MLSILSGCRTTRAPIGGSLTPSETTKKKQSFRIFCQVITLCILCVFAGTMASSLQAASESPGGMVAIHGQPASVIVVGNHASPSDRFVAGELQRYIEMLSGAKLALIAQTT